MWSSDHLDRIVRVDLHLYELFGPLMDEGLPRTPGGCNAKNTSRSSIFGLSFAATSTAARSHGIETNRPELVDGLERIFDPTS